MQAELDGQGGTLLGPPLKQSSYDSGVLVSAINVPPLPQRGYNLCQPTGVTASEDVREIHRWLELELGRGDGSVRLSQNAPISRHLP